ncbi:hypothetical protein K491DRAFT_697557 [Lophiostoma macrostomum CBS 122681]|uniref:Uncharacterized protein n=1 Tax=Lophiostoma macrostomum CBS 122681 TaxID=1314788 RepID=A0A6A6SSV2_9PLEO|nr:hypothetical protein K491DRAFT_697557 [Lophiostoma macrostomum CBS 122681]
MLSTSFPSRSRPGSHDQASTTSRKNKKIKFLKLLIALALFVVRCMTLLEVMLVVEKHCFGMETSETFELRFGLLLFKVGGWIFIEVFFALVRALCDYFEE